MSDRLVSVAHSPDLDDVFMVWAIRTGRLATPGRRWHFVAEDIEVLNREASRGTYDVTAISFGAYPEIRGLYDVLGSGASIGEGYGPVIVANHPLEPHELAGRKIAIPGFLTTAYLVLRLAVRDFIPVEMPFKTIGPAVRNGDVDAGVLIHEGQLTWSGSGLSRVLDLGVWWKSETGAALPLGGNAIRGNLPHDEKLAIARDLRLAIEYGRAHRDLALRESLEITRSLDFERGLRYLDMYVSPETVTMSEGVRAGLTELYARARRAGLLRHDVAVRFIDA